MNGDSLIFYPVLPNRFRTFVVEKFFVADDAGFFFNFGVCLPTPTSGSAFFFLPNLDTRFDVESEKRFDRLPPCRFRDVLNIDDLKRLFRFEVEFPHRRFLSEVAAASAARSLILRRLHRVSAAFANVPILPRSVAVMIVFHNDAVYAEYTNFTHLFIWEV